MRAILKVLMLTFATQAEVKFGNLCIETWWETATEPDVQADLDTGVDVMGWLRGETGLFITTP